MAIYRYSFVLDFFGKNPAVSLLIGAIGVQLGRIQLEVDDKNFDQLAADIKDQGFQLLDVDRQLVAPLEKLGDVKGPTELKSQAD